LGRLFSNGYHEDIGRLLLANKVRDVLEVGPGDGKLLEHLHKIGLNVTGVELDPGCAEQIVGKGLRCHRGTLETAKDSLGTFDAVIMSHVLEHVYHPALTLKTAHSVLRDGGLLYLALPNIGSLEARLFGKYWRGLDLPRHISHFDRDTVADLLHGCGFDITSMRNLPFPSSFVESVGFLATRNGRLAPGLYYPLYYLWKGLSPLHVPLLGSGVLELVAIKH
jgi:SAM-dependent methyltransferase